MLHITMACAWGAPAFHGYHDAAASPHHSFPLLLRLAAPAGPGDCGGFRHRRGNPELPGLPQARRNRLYMAGQNPFDVAEAAL